MATAADQPPVTPLNSLLRKRYKCIVRYNENHKADFDYAFKVNKIILICTSTWYYRSGPLKVVRIIGATLQASINALLFFTFLLEMCTNEDLTAADLIDAGSFLMVLVGYHIKYLMCLWYSRRLRIIYDYLEKDWQFLLNGSYDTMRNGATFARKLTIYYTAFIALTIMSWHANALSTKVRVIDNVTHHNLAYPVNYYFFDPSLMPSFAFVYASQLAAAILGVSVLCQNCNGAVIISHATAQCRVFLQALESISKENGNEDHQADNKLSYVVKKHNDLLKMMNLFNSVFNWVFLTEWIACVSTLCLACYFTVTQPFNAPNIMKNVTLFLTGAETFFLICYVGEQYTATSDEFGELFVMTDWHNLNKKHLDAFIMILVNGFQPKSITAGSIINLTMSTFADIMKRTLAFFNFLKTTL